MYSKERAMLFAKLFIMFRMRNESLMNSQHIRSAAYLHNLKAFGAEQSGRGGGTKREESQSDSPRFD